MKAADVYAGSDGERAANRVQEAGADGMEILLVLAVAVEISEEHVRQRTDAAGSEAELHP